MLIGEDIFVYFALCIEINSQIKKQKHIHADFLCTLI